MSGRSIKTAIEKRAWAGQDEFRDLWDLSKREILEALIHKTAKAEFLILNHEESAVAREVRAEIQALREIGLI